MNLDKNIVLVRQGEHKGKIGVYVEDFKDMAVVILDDPSQKTQCIKIKHEHLLDVTMTIGLINYLSKDI